MSKMTLLDIEMILVLDTTLTFKTYDDDFHSFNTSRKKCTLRKILVIGQFNSLKFVDLPHIFGNVYMFQNSLNVSSYLFEI